MIPVASAARFAKLRSPTTAMASYTSASERCARSAVHRAGRVARGEREAPGEVDQRLVALAGVRPSTQLVEERAVDGGRVAGLVGL